MTKKKKSKTGKRSKCSAWCRIIKVFSYHRPAEIDEELEKVRQQMAEAKRITDSARATLDGEDFWFIDKDVNQGEKYK